MRPNLTALEPRLSDEIATLLAVQLGCSYAAALPAVRAAVERLAPHYERLRETAQELRNEVVGDDTDELQDIAW